MARLVFITGAASGLGQALAWRYHQAGAELALVGRRESEIKSWAEQRGISPKRYKIYSADVANAASIVAAGEACLRQQGVQCLRIGGFFLWRTRDLGQTRGSLTVN